MRGCNQASDHSDQIWERPSFQKEMNLRLRRSFFCIKSEISEFKCSFKFVKRMSNLNPPRLLLRVVLFLSLLRSSDLSNVHFFLREDVSRDWDCGIIIIFGYHHHQRLWCTIMVLHPARIFIVVILQRDELFGGIGYESKQPLCGIFELKYSPSDLFLLPRGYIRHWD